MPIASITRTAFHRFSFRQPALCRLYSTNMKKKLIIFDTTLRDGEQSPGASLNIKEKLRIARQLSRLGVDVCEAGFPVASHGDFNAVRKISQNVGPLLEGRISGKPMIICGLARSTEKDIQLAYDAVKEAPCHRIHTFIATSDIHLKHKLKISRKKCVQQAITAVKFAKNRVEDVEFSAEDAGRSDPAFLAEVFSEVIKAGCTTINVPDTVGFMTPAEYGALIKYVIENTEDSEKAIWSTHCHNDLGLAVANTLCGVTSGARQVEVTMNGIGERAGNTSLEEIVMNLHTRPNLYTIKCDIDTTQILRTSKMVSSLTGIPVQPNKAIIGANAFAHEAGIHQDGMLKHSETYEIMKPETIGLKSSLVMGKHSGKHAMKERLMDLGFDDVSEDKNMLLKVFNAFKIVADSKKHVTDTDLEAIVNNELVQPEQLWKINSVVVTAGVHNPTATVSLKSPDGRTLEDASLGAGPIEAIYKAISRVIGINIKLIDYRVEAVSEGKDALGNVYVRIQNLDQMNSAIYADDIYHGQAAHVDTVLAAARAFISSINVMLSTGRRRYSKQIRPPGRIVV